MQTIHLNSNNFRLYPRVYMVQNDTGRDLKMVLDDITLAGTETGAVAIKRSDFSFYTISATLVAADNAFTADMTQALTQPGLTECQLKVTAADDTVVSSYTFVIFVQPSTDGISEEQLGYSVQDLMDAAQTIISGGITPDLKAALLQLASKVAYIDGDGQDYYDALDAALNPPVDLVSISAVYTQSGTVYNTDSLDSLKSDLVVTAHYSNAPDETVSSSDYTLSGSLTVGTSTITVSYGGKTDTFSVTVTERLVPAGYTAYDYIYCTTSSSIANSNLIKTKTYDNLNAISAEFTYMANVSSVGDAIFGGRTASGYTSSLGFYAATSAFNMQVHGRDIANLAPAAANTLHTVKYTNTAASPSSVNVDGTDYEITWSNNNTINTYFSLFTNHTNNTDGNAMKMNIKLGTITIKDLNGDVINKYVPCVRDSDQVIGLYDSIENLFYTAATVSAATIGNASCKYALGNWS